MGRRILLGVSGGIAAYKAVYLARRLLEEGHEVEVVMTEAATRFVGLPTFAGVTGRTVHTDFFDDAYVSPHTELARWAEGIVVAPATATILAKIASGLADDLVSATVLASEGPVLLAPAMHTEMWNRAATQRNVATIRDDGINLIGPNSGGLAGGDVGVGRMAEPEEILVATAAMLSPTLAGKRVLVTAGGTREAIDPVRFIGNRSTGKMGYAIAGEAARRGAQVTLVTAALRTPPPGVKAIDVESAEDMAREVWARAAESDVLVMAAAVADFRPAAVEGEKIRRAAGPPSIEMTTTPDVLGGLDDGSSRPYVVAFAAETGGLDGAVRKAVTKRVDMTVANDVSEEGSGFGSDTNRVAIIDPDGSIDAWPMLPKAEVARRLWDLIERRI